MEVTGQSIAMLTVGGLATVAFFVWTRFAARHPLLPFSLLKNRTLSVSMSPDRG